MLKLSNVNVISYKALQFIINYATKICIGLFCLIGYVTLKFSLFVIIVFVRLFTYTKIYIFFNRQGDDFILKMTRIINLVAKTPVACKDSLA